MFLKITKNYIKNPVRGILKALIYRIFIILFGRTNMIFELLSVRPTSDRNLVEKTVELVKNTGFFKLFCELF